MAWSQEISQLVTEVDQLTATVNVKKTVLENAANTAVVAANDATVAASASATSAGQAAGSAAQALAIYGSVKAQQTAVATAQAQASLAAGHAASAASVVQQDLSGINAAALHRSPNAITSMFIYDTSKDSDGGAWTERCQHTSWWNEPISGKWLGAVGSEFMASAQGATLGPNAVANASLDQNANGFTTFTGATIVSEGGRGKLTGSGTQFCGVFADFTDPASLTANVLYEMSFDLYAGTYTGAVSISSDGQDPITSYASPITSYASVQGGFTRYTAYMVPGVFTNGSNSRRLRIRFDSAHTAGQFVFIDNVSYRRVTALTTASGDYFQLASDGRFYRLWRNRFSWTEDFTNAAWSKVNGNVTMNGVEGLFIPTANDGFHGIMQRRDATTHERTMTVEVKAAGYTKAVLCETTNTGSQSRVVDLTNGSFVGTHGGTTTTVTPLADGWYRISWYSTGFSQFNSNWAIMPVPDTGVNTGINVFNQSWTADGVSGIRIRFPQIEYAPAFTSYERKVADQITSEVFRGNKRDFPRLAGIVFEGTSGGAATIYDLTESGRPMWMRFNCAANQNMLGWTGSNPVPATAGASNGVVALGGINIGLVMFNFPRDDVRLADSGNYSLVNRTIASRNSYPGYYSVANDTFIIASRTVNAVAMTVLPDAPVDPVTGLRVPTIAVATGAGVSVIKHDGTVESRGSYAAASQSTVSFDGYNVVIGGIGLDSYWGAWVWNFRDGSTQPYGTYAVVKLNNNNSLQMVRKLGEEYASPQGAGLNLLRSNKTAPSKALLTRIAPTFNTGWMTGDIRRCFLSDTEVGELPCGEIGWPSGSLTVASFANTAGHTITDLGDRIRIERTSAYVTNPTLDSQLVVANVAYSFEFEVLAVSADATAFYNITNGGNTGLVGNTYVGVGRYRHGAIASGTGNGTIRFSFAPARSADPANAVVGDFIEISKTINVVRAVSDRSYRAVHQSVFGTLTRAQLASGTSLVGYSGFSAANYLREPYSADLDFGTGEWTVSAWVNVPATLTDAMFGATSVPTTLDTAEWSKGTGWSAPNANSFSCNGSQTGQTDLSWVSGNRLTSNSGVIKRWTVTVTAISGTLVVYANNGSPFNITAPGTYYGYSNPTNGTEDTAILRMAGAGQTCTGTLAMDDLSPSRIVERSHTSGPSFRLGINRNGQLTATVSDGTTTRTVTTSAAYNTAQWLKARVNYTTDGTLAILVNGREMAATRGAPLLTLNNASAVLTIGNSFALDAPFPGSIALLKLSATVPTQEQATFMYEQEKQLFRAGALSVLPDSGAIVDMSYDDATDRWVAVSASNESYWTGLVRNSVTPVPAGSYTRIATTSGVELISRSTTNPGVDITIPPYGLREELVKRAEAAARLSRLIATYDYVGGFTGNITTGSTAIASVTNLTYPTSYIGARISGAGIPVNAFITGVSGTTIYISAPASVTTTGVSISFLDFILPVGQEAKVVMSAGTTRREGSTADYTRLYDGFKETIRFGSAPGATTWVQIQSTGVSQ